MAEIAMNDINEFLVNKAVAEVSKPGAVLEAAEKLGVKSLRPINEAIGAFQGMKEVAATGAAAGAAVASATSLTVAATSGAGITSALAAAGGLGGMAAAPAVLAGGPAYLATQGLNKSIFRHEEGLSTTESSARSAARTGTKLGAAAGVVGTGAAVVAGGSSGAAIMGTLATIGGAVGGGAIAGTAILVAAPAAMAAAAGYGIYKLFGGGKSRRSRR